MRHELIKIALENNKISERGWYEINGRKIEIATENTSEFTGQYSKINIKDNIKETNKTNIQVINKSVINALQELGDKSKERIGILNFSSARNPGAGYINGRMSQESSICYSSNLYNQLVGNKYYEINNYDGTALYTDSMIVTDITVFRSEEWELLEKIYIGIKVITCPPVDMELHRKQRGTDIEAYDIMKNRMRKIIRKFINIDCRNIIIGAYGCGESKNEPIVIANIWENILSLEGHKKYFDNIIFAVLDRGGELNYRVFKGIIK